MLFGFALLLSDNRKAINRRTVLIAFALQVGIAALILYVPRGDALLNGLASGVQNVIDYAYVGIDFLFGALGERKPGAIIFAFHVLPVIVFFAALMATLYYLGVMQKGRHGPRRSRCTGCCGPAASSRCPRSPTSSSATPRRRW